MSFCRESKTPWRPARLTELISARLMKAHRLIHGPRCVFNLLFCMKKFVVTHISIMNASRNMAASIIAIRTNTPSGYGDI